MPIEFRPVGVVKAAVWLLGPFVAGWLLVGGLYLLLWLRARGRGGGEILAFGAIPVVVGLCVWMSWLLFRRFRGSRADRLCLVVPPRALLAGAGKHGSQFPGLMATAPLMLRCGQLIVADQGEEHPLAGAVDHVVVGVWRGRWCCYARFTRAGQTKRGQALGILPAGLRNADLLSIDDDAP